MPPRRLVLTLLLCLAFASTTAFAGLVAYWPFEEGSGLTTENVVQASDDDLINGPTWVTTGLGPIPGGTTAALDFSGGNKQVVVANSYKGVTGTADRTVSAWVRTSGPGDQDIISWGLDAPAPQGQKWVFRTQDDNGPLDGVLRVEVNGGYIVGNQDIRDGQWHHVAATLVNDGSANVEEVRLYVDGMLQAPSTRQGQSMSTAVGEDVRIASEVWNTGRPFNGDMDDVRVYDEALASAAIRALSGTAVAPMASYNAYDDMDGNSVWENRTAFGATATSADYTLIGDVTRIEWPATQFLALHGSYAFDGTGDEGRLGSSAEDFLTGNISQVPATLEIWFKPDDLLGQEVLWEFGGNGDGASFTLNNDLLQVTAKNGGSNVGTVFDLDVGDDGADYDDFIQAVAAIDLDQNELVFFINGTPIATVSASGNMQDWAGGDGVGLGGMNGGSVGGDTGAFTGLSGYGNFAGQIAVVNVYSSVLDADEVMAAYSAVALPEPGTLALVALGVGLLRRRRRR